MSGGFLNTMFNLLELDMQLDMQWGMQSGMQWGVRNSRRRDLPLPTSAAHSSRRRWTRGAMVR